MNFEPSIKSSVRSRSAQKFRRHLKEIKVLTANCTGTANELERFNDLMQSHAQKFRGHIKEIKVLTANCHWPLPT